jgi:hypothetical protein
MLQTAEALMKRCFSAGKAEREVLVEERHSMLIEGYALLILGRRLKRTFGWGSEMFELA